ncbi:hypothetical protein C8J57DRAFT_1491835 [Mycena rebaudengoi]|nr:hypothetical protein C8J57DRAFT_1491835 [Mycena rebaudengoi]
MQFLIISFIRLLLKQAGLTALLSEQWSARQLIAELLEHVVNYPLPLREKNYHSDGSYIHFGFPSDLKRSPPPDAEIPVIRDIIADEQSRLLDLDAQIAALRKILEPLVNERNITADKILRHQSIFSAARRIPPEILGEIFLSTLPAQEAMWHKTSAVSSSPWLVGRICSRWRKIALALPELWTTVSIDHLSYELERNDAYPSVLLCRLKTLLHRSANRPLHMELGFPYSWPPSPELLEALADSSPQWETVQAASSWFSPGGTMDRIKGRLDRLISLSCFHGSLHGELFAEVPQLRRLESMQGFASDFPLASLTYLKSDVFSLSEFTRILPQLVNIVECDISGWDEQEDDTATDDISLPALQKLYLNGMPLPSSLTAPKLTEIRLHSRYLDTLPHVVSRSGCDLQSVTLLLPLDSTAAISFSALQHCPTIRDLKIFDAGDINPLCDALTVRRDSPIWLPKLNDIKFLFDAEDPTSVSGFAQLNLETFVAMLKTRWNVAGCARICHVHIEAWWHVKPRYIEALLSRLREFDDGELSLWLTDFIPSSGDTTAMGISGQGSYCHYLIIPSSDI